MERKSNNISKLYSRCYYIYMHWFKIISFFTLAEILYLIAYILLLLFWDYADNLIFYTSIIYIPATMQLIVEILLLVFIKNGYRAYHNEIILNIDKISSEDEFLSELTKRFKKTYNHLFFSATSLYADFDRGDSSRQWAALMNPGYGLGSMIVKTIWFVVLNFYSLLANWNLGWNFKCYWTIPFNIVFSLIPFTSPFGRSASTVLTFLRFIQIYELASDELKNDMKQLYKNKKSIYQVAYILKSKKLITDTTSIEYREILNSLKKNKCSTKIDIE